MDDQDKGHEHLIEDIESLLIEAKEKEFHDFENVLYPAPKMALVQKLEAIIHNVKNGKYDN